LKDKFNNLFFRLHAIALKNGKDVVTPAVLDQNTILQVPGTGVPPSPNTAGKVHFDPPMHFNRAKIGWVLHSGQLCVPRSQRHRFWVRGAGRNPDKADKGKKEVIGCGKDPTVYLVDRKAMTPAKLHQTGNQLDQLALVTSPLATPITPGGTGLGVWGGLACYCGPLGNIFYYCGDHGPLQAIPVKKGKVAPHMVPPGAPNQTFMTDPNEAFPNEGGCIPVVLRMALSVIPGSFGA